MIYLYGLLLFVGDLMTLVEFFDKDAILNIFSTLYLHPQRTIIFGCNYDALSRFKKKAEEVLRNKNIETEIICIETVCNDFEKLKSTFCDVIEEYEDCAFDLSGGDSLIHTAMGAVSEKNSVSMHTVNVSKGKINVIFDNNDLYKEKHPVKLSIQEIVTLYGGIVEQKNSDKNKLSGEFVTDIKVMWSICNKNCSEWNKTISGLSSIVKRYSKGVDGGYYIADLSEIYDGHRQVNRSFHLNENIVQRLMGCGFLSVKTKGKSLWVSFKNDFIREILTKSGRLLELYTFMIGSTILKENLPFYDDYETSVLIKWEDEVKGIHDLGVVSNEIDVMFIKGAVPVFVSCKNGHVATDELYKLYVVGEKFGGKMSDKILVSSYFEPDEFFLNRAEELGIKVIFNVDKMSFRKFSDRLSRKAM